MSGPHGFRTVWGWLALAALAVLLVFIVYPVFNIVALSVKSGFSADGGWVQLVTDTRYLDAIRNSLVLSFVVTVLCVLIGVPLAYVSARYRFPGKALIVFLPLLTLVIPEIIAAQTWLMMLGNNGLVTRFLRGYGIHLPSFYGWFGLITVMTFIYYTYVYIGTLAAISGFDKQLEEAAQSLGTSPAKSRLRVMIPVIMPAILASALLVFAMVIGNFATSLILSHGVKLLSVETYQAAVSEGSTSPVMQSTLASVSILILAAILFVNRWLVSRGRYEIVQGRGATPSGLSGLDGLLVGLAAGLVVLISLLPMISIVIGAFTASSGPVMRWGEWTTQNLARVFVTAPTPLINSLTYAGSATVIGVAFSTLVSYLIIKKPNIITPWLDYISSVPLALSGTVLGIGLVVSFNSGWLTLSGTAMMFIVAYVVRRLPFGMRNASSTLYNIPNSIEEASISLGSPPLRTFVRVVIPIMVPAIVSAAVLTWTTTVSELSASVLVYSGGQETLPIQVFRLLNSGLMAYASAYGLTLLVVIMVPIIVVVKILKIDIFSSSPSKPGS